MTIGNDLIDLAGEDLMDSSGNDIVIDATGKGCVGAPTRGAAPPLCRDKNTCDKFCNEAIAAYEQSPDCPCPCKNGKTAAPESFRFTWTGITIKEGDFIGPDDDGHYYKVGGIAGSGTLDIDVLITGGCSCRCNTLNGTDGGPLITVTLYDSDQTTILSPPANRNVEFVVGAVVGNCSTLTPGGPENLYIFAQVFWDVAFTGSGNIIAAFNKSVVSGGDDPTTAASSGISCDGATANPSAGDSQVVASPGTITVTPVCRDCEDAQLDQTGSPAEICSYEYDVFVEMPDGPIDPDTGLHTVRTHHFELFGGPPSSTRWDGADQFGNTGNIQTANSNPDDPDQKCCELFGEGCECGGSPCPGCWIMTLDSSVGSTSAQWFSTGSCPGENGWTAINAEAEADTLDSTGFVEGCHP